VRAVRHAAPIAVLFFDTARGATGGPNSDGRSGDANPIVIIAARPAGCGRADWFADAGVQWDGVYFDVCGRGE